MRIIFSDWVIALDKGRLPRQYDDGEPLEVVNAPDGWAWTLNTQLDGNLDVIPLTATNGVVGTTLSKSQLALAGDYWLQLTGTKDGVTRHTNIIGMAVPASLSGDANWPTLPTAFSDALDRAEDAADRAESAATHGPRISGTNTWEVWDPDKGQYVDTMVDASGKTGPQGPAGAGMDITGATVGQIAKITAVDASGVPTAWEAVDMGGETWEKIASGEMAETAKLEISKDNNGLPFSLKSAQILVRGDISISQSSCMSVSAKRWVSHKDYDSYSVEVFFGKENPKVNLWYVLREKTMPMLFWEIDGIDWQSADCKVLMGVHLDSTDDKVVRNKDILSHLINDVAIGATMGNGNMAAGCKYEIWGVRA